MAFEHHLEEDELDELFDAAVAARLNNEADLQALLAGMSPAYVGKLLVGGTVNAKLLTALHQMNRDRVLTNGQVPLLRWLKNAMRLAAGLPEQKVFRRAIAEVSPDAVAAADVPPDVDGAPRRDDGGLEIDIGQDDTLGVAFLHSGVMTAQSVALLQVHRHFDGAPSFVTGDKPDYGVGTGWIIAPRLLITNHHVIAARESSEAPVTPDDFDLQGRGTLVRFDFYEKDAETQTSRALECVAHDPRPELDYALLRLPHDAPARAPLALRKHAITKAATQALQARVNVLQHPDGDPMTLGFRNNFVVSGGAQRLSYLTDTAGGSSGSPVCDDSWLVAALHRGWTPLIEAPVVVWGTEVWKENYGTPIPQIISHLGEHHPALAAEIEAGQP